MSVQYHTHLCLDAGCLAIQKVSIHNSLLRLDMTEKQGMYDTRSQARSFAEAACVFAANVGVPVSEMDDSYVKESATLSEAIIKYGTLDLYDPQRVQVINVSSNPRSLHTPAMHTSPQSPNVGHVFETPFARQISADTLLEKQETL